MNDELKVKVEILERRVARLKLLGAILFALEIARFFPKVNKVLEENFLFLLLLLAALFLTIPVVYAVERAFSKEKDTEGEQ